METYKQRLAETLAETGGLFFDRALFLKDGRPTPYFVNLGMFRTGRLSMELGSYFAAMMVARGLAAETDIVLGPSYKGSAIALATVIALHAHHGHDLRFEYDRKEAKTHGEVSRSGSLFVNRTFFDGCRVFVVDDVATSMGTKYDLLDKIRGEAEAGHMSVRINGIGIAVDREQTTAVYDENGRVLAGERGEDAIQAFVRKTGIPVFAVAGIREIIDHLFEAQVPVLIQGERRPIDKETRSLFEAYMETYGVREGARTEPRGS